MHDILCIIPMFFMMQQYERSGVEVLVQEQSLISS